MSTRIARIPQRGGDVEVTQFVGPTDIYNTNGTRMCIELTSPSGEMIILDAKGARSLGRTLTSWAASSIPPDHDTP